MKFEECEGTRRDLERKNRNATSSAEAPEITKRAVVSSLSCRTHATSLWFDARKPPGVQR